MSVIQKMPDDVAQWLGGAACPSHRCASVPDFHRVPWLITELTGNGNLTLRQTPARGGLKSRAGTDRAMLNDASRTPRGGVREPSVNLGLTRSGDGLERHILRRI